MLASPLCFSFSPCLPYSSPSIFAIFFSIFFIFMSMFAIFSSVFISMSAIFISIFASTCQQCNQIKVSFKTIFQHLTVVLAFLVTFFFGFREIHHFCLLLGYGADAICPYLVFEVVQILRQEGNDAICKQ